MRTRILPNGDLVILAGNQDRAALHDAYVTGGYPGAESVVVEQLREGCAGLELIPPENIAALTDAPILAKAFWPDEGGGPVPYVDSPVWWFPNYCIRDPWDELKNIGRVVFTRAREDK
jgi:hypothetical protein